MTSDDTIRDAYDALTNRIEVGGAVSGLPSGFHDLDAITGGLHRKQVVVVGGRPTLGKTSLSLNLAAAVAVEGGGRVALATMQLSSERAMLALMCSVGKVATDRVIAGTPNEGDWPHLVQAVGELHSAEIDLIDDRSITPQELRNRVNAMPDLTDSPLDLLVVDGLQTLRGGAYKDAPSHERLDHAMQELRLLAQERDCAVVVTSQLNRFHPDRRNLRPNLFDLPSPVDQLADAVYLLHRPDADGEVAPEWQGKAEIIVAKQQGGSAGRSSVTGFLGRYMKFVNLTRQSVDETRLVTAAGSPA
jgi:replicative DNA helicase